MSFFGVDLMGPRVAASFPYPRFVLFCAIRLPNLLSSIAPSPNKRQPAFAYGSLFFFSPGILSILQTADQLSHRGPRSGTLNTSSSFYCSGLLAFSGAEMIMRRKRLSLTASPSPRRLPLKPTRFFAPPSGPYFPPAILHLISPYGLCDTLLWPRCPALETFFLPI